MSIENSYINAITSTVAKYHAVSPESLLEAWNEMERHKDVCYAKTAYDIINALGGLADLYADTSKVFARASIISISGFRFPFSYLPYV